MTALANTGSPIIHKTYFLSLFYSLFIIPVISWLALYDLYGGAALFCFLSPCWDYFPPSQQIKITQTRCCLCLRDAHVYALSPLCTSLSIPALLCAHVCVCACMQEGNLTSVCSEWAQQCKVNPVTVCRDHLRQKEAVDSMRGHADPVSNKDRGKILSCSSTV